MQVHLQSTKEKINLISTSKLHPNNFIPTAPYLQPLIASPYLFMQIEALVRDDWRS